MTRNSTICVAFTWEAMNHDFLHDNTLHRRCLSPSRHRSTMQDDVIPLFHTVGTLLSYLTFRMWTEQTVFVDPNNARFEFYEEEGQTMLWRYCRLNSKKASTNDRDLNIEEVKVYLVGPKPISIPLLEPKPSSIPLVEPKSFSILRQLRAIGSGLKHLHLPGFRRTQPRPALAPAPCSSLSPISRPSGSRVSLHM